MTGMSRPAPASELSAAGRCRWPTPGRPEAPSPSIRPSAPPSGSGSTPTQPSGQANTGPSPPTSPPGAPQQAMPTFGSGPGPASSATGSAPAQNWGHQPGSQEVASSQVQPRHDRVQAGNLPVAEEGLLERLLAYVERAKQSDPQGWTSKAEARLLAALRALLLDRIPRDPLAAQSQQGNTLGQERRHWFREL